MWWMYIIYYYILYVIRYTLYVIRYTLYAIRYTLYVIRYTLYVMRYALYVISPFHHFGGFCCTQQWLQENFKIIFRSDSSKKVQNFPKVGKIMAVPVKIHNIQTNWSKFHISPQVTIKNT